MNILEPRIVGRMIVFFLPEFDVMVVLLLDRKPDFR